MSHTGEPVRRAARATLATERHLGRAQCVCSEAATRPLVTQLASGGAGVPEVALEGPRVDRGSDSWRMRAAAVVAAREAQCWRALIKWLEAPGAAEFVRETLLEVA